MNSDQGKCIRRALAAVVQRLVDNNDTQGETGRLTKFHAQRVPGIGVADYIARLMKYSGCSFEALVLSLVYIDRLIQRNGFVLCSLNVHRVCVTSIMLGAKFFDDTYYNNAYFARIGGLPVAELNRLEIDFLYLVNFSLHATADTYHRYFTELRDHALAMYPRGGLGTGPLPIEAVTDVEPLCFHLHNACYTSSSDVERRRALEEHDLARLEAANRDAEVLVDKALRQGRVPSHGRPAPVHLPNTSDEGQFFHPQSQQNDVCSAPQAREATVPPAPAAATASLYKRRHNDACPPPETEGARADNGPPHRRHAVDGPPQRRGRTAASGPQQRTPLYEPARKRVVRPVPGAVSDVAHAAWTGHAHASEPVMVPGAGGGRAAHPHGGADWAVASTGVTPWAHAAWPNPAHLCGDVRASGYRCAGRALSPAGAQAATPGIAAQEQLLLSEQQRHHQHLTALMAQQQQQQQQRQGGENALRGEAGRLHLVPSASRRMGWA